MDQIAYVGEHLLPGYIGHMMVVVAFIASGLSLVSYIKGLNSESIQWRNLGRYAYTVQAIAAVGIISLLLFMMMNHYYEYSYVQAHVNDDLPMEYVLSALWEGQEGSFLLWIFWNSVLGLVALYNRDKWEAGIGIVFAMSQLILFSMILGVHIYIGESFMKIGSSPFVLFRDTIDAPIFANKNYLELIDGQGLNELLQNYWNVIHPPVTFLGFSALMFPFAFSIASLLKKDYTGWLKPARNWALFGGAVLGLGILMGAAWAYEALTFGGYWAWDPVENMVLVPWMMLVAGLHTNVVAISTRQSIKSTYIFYGLSFILILYSTYLTRSGALGDTSVHSFTEMGLENQLLILIASFIGLWIFQFVKNYKHIPAPEKEEKSTSREFIMFIGALTIVISSVLITYGTSLPIINRLVQLFNPDFQAMVINDPVSHYNKNQLWIGIILGLLTGVAQFFRYREKNWTNQKYTVLKQTSISVVVALVLTFGLSFWINAVAWQYLLLMFSAIFAIIANVLYLFSFAQEKTKYAGSVLSHVGYGILILGVLASGLNKEIISRNFFAQRGLANIDDEVLKKNIVLIKDKPMYMNGYQVTYESDTLKMHNREYTVTFKKLDEEMNTLEDEFVAYPNLLYNRQFDDVAAVNPSIRRGVVRDIFTHITSIPATTKNPQKLKEIDDSLKYEMYTAELGEQVFSKGAAITVKSINNTSAHPNYEAKPGDYVISPSMEIHDVKNDTSYFVDPTLVLRAGMLYSLPIEIKDLSLRLRLSDSTLTDVLIDEQMLDFQDVLMKQGETIDIGEYTLTMNGISQEVKDPNYVRKEGDIAFSVLLDVVEKATGRESTLAPVFLIRNSETRNMRDIDLATGLNARIVSVDPKTETFAMQYAYTSSEMGSKKIYFEVAEDVPETDYIVLQAIIFPGINLVWLGSLLMVTGMALSLYVRKRNRSQKNA